MDAKVIPGFSALKFKEEVQERVYTETKGLTAEERIQYFREAAENGLFAGRWRHLPPAMPTRDADAHSDEPVGA